MRKRFLSPVLAGAAALLIAPGVALAQVQAYTNAPVVVYAGPGDDYPAVAQLPGGVAVTVMGCVDGYQWCDVALPDLRGWAYGGSLSYPYQGANVPVVSYGSAIGLPIVVFSLGAYWGSYYRNRPWYHDQARWEHRPPPPPHGGPPPGHGGPPPGHGGPPQYSGPPPGHGGPPPGHEGPPPGHGGPPPGHEGPPPGHGGPPPSHGGGEGHPPPHEGGGHEGGHGGGDQEHSH